jgi:hypothetical protein
LQQALSIDVIWFDNDCLALRIRASNGRFCATAEVYADLDAISTIAKVFRSFPTSSDDRRELVLGAFDPGDAGGGVRLTLRCVNRAGHAVLDVDVRAEPQQTGAISETAKFATPTEAAFVDDFVSQLDRVKQLAIGPVAQLRSVDTT